MGINSPLLQGRLFQISVILNEYGWVQDRLNEPDLGKHPTETLKLVAMYYMDTEKDQKVVREMVEKYLLSCEPSASLVLWDKAISSAIKQADRRPILKVPEIVITKPEMEVIDEIKGRQGKRLATTLLCLSKYWDLCREENNHWASNKNTEIMKLANISASSKRQGALYRQLEDDGLLHFPERIDAISMQVLYTHDGEPEMSVSDFRNIGYQYLMHKGEPFFACAECGIVTKIKNPGVGRPPKYCPSCAIKVSTQQKVNHAMKFR